MIDHKSLPRKENQARTQTLIHAHHSLPLHITLQSGFCPKLFVLVLEFSSLPVHLQKQAVPPKSLLIFKCVKFFWQDNHLSFSPPASYLLAAPCLFFTNTRSIQIDHILTWNSLCSVTCPNVNKCQGKELFHVIIIENPLPVKSCYFHKERDCLDQGREVRFRSWGEWCVVIITLRIFAAFLIQRSEPCLPYVTTAGYVILCKLLRKFHNSCNKQESLN